jgi:enamine deaminase RidA (YjgF/YER057c/UK114 family)
MVRITKVKTGNKYEESVCYSRAVAVGDWIFVSNTAGRDPKTGEMPEHIVAQTRQIFANIDAALKSVNSSLADVVSARVFVPNPDEMSSAMEVFAETFRGIDPALTVTSPALGSAIYKIEVELTAYRGASSSEVEKIHINV